MLTPAMIQEIPLDPVPVFASVMRFCKPSSCLDEKSSLVHPEQDEPFDGKDRDLLKQ